MFAKLNGKVDRIFEAQLGKALEEKLPKQIVLEAFLFGIGITR